MERRFSGAEGPGHCEAFGSGPVPRCARSPRVAPRPRTRPFSTHASLLRALGPVAAAPPRGRRPRPTLRFCTAGVSHEPRPSAGSGWGDLVSWSFAASGGAHCPWLAAPSSIARANSLLCPRPGVLPARAPSALPFCLPRPRVRPL